MGDREEIIAQANDAEAEGAYVYGRDEVEGTSWIYVSDVSFGERGFPDVGTERYPSHSLKIWASQFVTVAVAATALGLYSLYLRKERMKGEQIK